MEARCGAAGAGLTANGSIECDRDVASTPHALPLVFQMQRSLVIVD